MFGKILSLTLKPVTTCGKRFLSVILIIFVKLLHICLLNLINHISRNTILCTVKSTWPDVQHICLILFRMSGGVGLHKGPPPTSFSPVTSTYELAPKTFWLLVLTLSLHWCKISSLYLVPVPNYRT